ncbi:MAG TPA: FkbM family methyltransferase [Solirubrobacteraceae bacterium]|nr:FkbM family methyltransferase [Solirubrobacteraceae bacterium]
MSSLDGPLTGARRLFYNLDGPWYRRGIAEAAGSKRYSRPALFGMDSKLESLMPHRGGTFFEAGAHDGYTQSNTYYLERHRGWSGVLVEPVPELRAKCARRRPRSQVFGCALVGPDHSDEDVTVHFGDLMSTVGASDHAAGGLAVVGRSPYSVSVPARTLSSVLDQAAVGPLDLMVLDLEGNELEALRGLDLDRHAPRHLLLETLERGSQQPALDEQVDSHYEFVEALSDFDLLYRLRA